MWDIKTKATSTPDIAVDIFHLNHVGYKGFSGVGRFWGASRTFI